MNRQAELFRNPFSSGLIEEVSYPFEGLQRHSTPHENRSVTAAKEKPQKNGAMQNYNSNI